MTIKNALNEIIEKYGYIILFFAVVIVFTVILIFLQNTGGLYNE